jgi:hypothetical protein
MMRALIALALVLTACSASPPVGPADRPWAIDDFERLAAREGCAGLPPPRSAAFAHMTDASVLARVAPPEQPLAERLPALFRYIEAFRPIFKRYGACSTTDAVLTTGTAMLEAFVEVWPLLEQHLATFSPADPTYETRVAGREKTRAGMLGLATGIAMVVRGGRFQTALAGVGHRFGVALARARAILPPEALDAVLGDLAVPPDDDPEPNRRAIRAEIYAALNAPVP